MAAFGAGDEFGDFVVDPKPPENSPRVKARVANAEF